MTTRRVLTFFRSHCVTPSVRVRPSALWLIVAALSVSVVATSGAQEDIITPINIAVGRSVPVSLSAAVTKVSIANPDVADVVVISTGELVINARAPGETDAIVWEENGGRKHYRVVVATTAQRKQIVVGIKFAEVDRNTTRDLGVSGLYEDAHNLVGTNNFSTGPGGTSGSSSSSAISIPASDFVSVLTNFNTQHLLGLLQTQEQSGHARMLAEPTVMAGNKEEASFIAGGQIPIPVVQAGGAATAGGSPITIQYKDYGIRLQFTAEILDDSLIRIKLAPEVSSLDYTNAITLSGFRVPALTTRRVESTVDVKRGQSLIISGMFNDVRSRNKTGIPFLMNIPLLGQLFSSTQWQRNETELLVVVTPTIADPLSPPAQSVVHLQADTTLPARGALEPRMAEPSGTSPPR
jgi:pilus assembly protein CpaC